ncbi:MAG: tRNA dimethylallyltransferase, partial [Pseudomonadota bacterium]
PSSVGRWLELARVAIDEAAGGGQPAIVVGGTGLYLYALLHGLAAVPIIPSEVRAAASKTYDELGGQEFHRALSALDPKMAERLRPHDRQRLVRAFEVVRATGRSLAAWQADPPIRVHLPQPVAGLMLLPPRAEVYARIEGRLDAMVLAGALEELRELQALRLSPELPLLKAVAVRELLAHLEGELDLAAALTRAKVQTRRYAKRQLTWLRHRMPELTQVPNFGDTPEIRKRPWLDWLGKSAGRAG